MDKSLREVLAGAILQNGTSGVIAEVQDVAEKMLAGVAVNEIFRDYSPERMPTVSKVTTGQITAAVTKVTKARKAAEAKTAGPRSESADGDKPAKQKKERNLTPEARQRIKDAQNRRWAAKNAEKKAAGAAAPEPAPTTEQVQAEIAGQNDQDWGGCDQTTSS